MEPAKEDNEYPPHNCDWRLLPRKLPTAELAVNSTNEDFPSSCNYPASSSSEMPMLNICGCIIEKRIRCHFIVLCPLRQAGVIWKLVDNRPGFGQSSRARSPLGLVRVTAKDLAQASHVSLERCNCACAAASQAHFDRLPTYGIFSPYQLSITFHCTIEHLAPSTSSLPPTERQLFSQHG